MALEIAWRCFFLIFAAAVLLGVLWTALDAVELRAGELAAFRSRNVYWILVAVARLFRRYQAALENALLIVAATVGGFWVLAGAVLRAFRYGRGFVRLVILRALELAAGAAALLSGLTVILTVSAWRQPPAFSLAVTGASCILVYFCWRWISLLLAVLENAPGVARGWQVFVLELPRLAVDAATNSTLKWLALAAATAPLVALVAALPARYWGLELVAAGLWIMALVWISGYFAARLRSQIAGLAWTTTSHDSPHA